MNDTTYHVRRLVAVLSHPTEVGTVFPWAVSLAREWELPLTLLHVIDPVTSRETSENARVMAEDMLVMLANSPQAAGVPVEYGVEAGMPTTEIPAFTERSPGSVFVLSGGEHGAFARTLLRRGSENVIHRLRAPFVFLPPAAGAPRPVERAIAGVDGSAIAAQALDVGRALLRRTEITTVEVLEPGSLPVSEYIAAAPVVTGERLRLRGRARIVLLAAARSLDAAMIVVGRHGSTGLFGQHLGGTAEWLSRNADRPVLVVPPEA